MNGVSEATRAALIPGDWPLPAPGMGLPEGWGVYPWGEHAAVIVPPLDERCEAACLTHSLIVRCLKPRGHEGLHMVHP